MIKLYDNHGRIINYLRLAVTDRCNLRCFYCMPEEGIKYMPQSDLLSFEEMERIIQILSLMGINKIRITGGEPFIRKDIMAFMTRVHQLEHIEKINLTTNGILTRPYIPELKKIGVTQINLSLDSLNRERFFEITRRDKFEDVMLTLEALLNHAITTKINMVVMDGKNIEDIIPMAELTKESSIHVRYIEEMPFNGAGNEHQKSYWNYKKIIAYLNDHYPSIQKITDPPNSTASHYKIPNYKGTIGIIAAYSRTFCGSCNRIRLTPQGVLKTCLYDEGVFNLKKLIRSGATDEQLRDTFLNAFKNRAKDGYEAETRRKGFPISESMSTIGG